MKTIKLFINENRYTSKFSKFDPEEYDIKNNDDAIEMLSDLFSRTMAPKPLLNAYLDGNFDPKCFKDDKWLKTLGNALEDTFNSVYDTHKFLKKHYK